MRQVVNLSEVARSNIHTIGVNLAQIARNGARLCRLHSAQNAPAMSDYTG